MNDQIPPFVLPGFLVPRSTRLVHELRAFPPLWAGAAWWKGGSRGLLPPCLVFAVICDGGGWMGRRGMLGPALGRPA